MKFEIPWEHVEATLEPLSSDVNIIIGKSEKWIFDVGSNDLAYKAINEEKGLKNAIISHFHADHSYNLSRVKLSKVYVSAYSSLHIKECISEYVIVKDDIYIEDGDKKLHIFEIPSSHSKGCIGLELDEKYIFLGDAAYAGHKDDKTLYNVGLVKAQLEKLKSLKGDIVILSHEKRPAYRKDTIIRNLERIYNMRESNNPYVEIKSK